MARVPMSPGAQELACAASYPPVSNSGSDLSLVYASLFDGERLLGVYRGCASGVRLLAVTNRRVMMVETTSCQRRTALTSVPFARITSVSYLASGDEYVAEATTVGMRVLGTLYELRCADEEGAREPHDLITWHLVCD